MRLIWTPRFAISCTDELLKGLEEMAKQDPSLAVQMHFNETRSEIDATLGLFPRFENEVDLYESFGLLGKRTILAHMTDYEVGMSKKSKKLGLWHGSLFYCE